MELPEIFNAEKSLPLRPVWLEEANDRLSLVSPLDIDGVTIEGLRFRITAMIPRLEECVTVQVEYIPPMRDLRGGALARIEWKPLKGHNNKNAGPLAHRNKFITASHHHRFDLNWNEQAAALRRGNLPIAVPVEPDPATFETLVDLVRQEFRISNLDWLQPPPWQATLF
jgi:hypothetical protein